MGNEATKPGKAEKVLSWFSLESRYRRIARFYPALITVALLLPLAIMLGIPLSGWLIAMSAGGGLAIGAAAVAHLSHFASAAGNRVQAKLYPKWPHDSPTNLRLHPVDGGASRQKKEKWYAAIQRLTGLDIASVAGDPEEVRRVINDAVAELRTRVFAGNKLAERLDMHNADFGMMRNFAGLRPVWLLTSCASCAGCWVTYAFQHDHVALPVVATALFVGCVFAALVIEDYVRVTGRHYADSFFGALDACDEECIAKAKKKAAAQARPSGRAVAGKVENADNRACSEKEPPDHSNGV